MPSQQNGSPDNISPPGGTASTKSPPWGNLATTPSVCAFARRIRDKVQDRHGALLLETIVAITVFAAVGLAVLLGVGAAHISGNSVEGKSIAEQLARNQMEYVFTQAYQNPPATYVSISDATDVTYGVPTGYTVGATAQEYQSGVVAIEKVTVTVNRDGQSLLVLETLRTNQ